MKNKKIQTFKENYWLNYTLFFTIAMGLSLYWIWGGGSSLTMQGDDFRQHYNALIYIGKWYRQIIRNIFVKGKLEIPLYEWGMGYGSDIITTLSYYGIADPFYAISTFVPAQYTEYLFWILIVIRSYFMGVFFSKYSFYKENDKFSTLVGSIIYICSGFNLGPALHQIIFQSGLVWVPLIFLGIEKIFKENKPKLYIISSAILLCSNIYFYYMVVYAIIIYCLVYVWNYHLCLSEIKKYIIAFTVNSIIPLLLTAFFSLHVILSLLSNDRVSFDYNVPMLYEIKYYFQLPALMFSMGSMRSLYLGFSPIAVLSLLVLFIKKQDNSLIALSIISIIFALIPWFGHLLNGNSFVCNRWSFMLAFLMAYISVKIIPEYWKLTKNEQRKIFIIWTIYFLYCFFVQENYNAVVMSAFVIGNIFLTCLIFIPKYKIFLRKVIVMLCVYLGICNMITWYGTTYTSRIKLGTGFTELVENNPARVLKHLIDGEYWRVDQSTGALKRFNQSFYYKVPTTEYYWSMTTPSVIQFFRDMELSNITGAIALGVDNRQYLENFLGVKYYLIKDGEETILPYGFQDFVYREKVENINYSIYKNTYSNYLIRYYKNKISKSKYELLPVEKKQEALLQATVSLESKNENMIQYQSQSIPYVWQNASDVVIENDKFIVENDNATVELLLNDKLDKGEMYVILEGVEFKGINPYKELMESDLWRKMKRIERWNYWLNYLQWQENNEVFINLEFSDISKSIHHFTADNEYGYGRDSYLCNMGYFTKPDSDIIKITFPVAGEYKYSDFRVILQPLDNLVQVMENMYTGIQQYSKVVTNGIDSTVKLKEDGYIQFAIPYSKGWSANVDNKEHPLEQSSTLFIGMDINAGEHNIELHYRTPGLKAGCIVTFCSMIVLCIPYLRKTIGRFRIYKCKRNKYSLG